MLKNRKSKLRQKSKKMTKIKILIYKFKNLKKTINIKNNFHLCTEARKNKNINLKNKKIFKIQKVVMIQMIQMMIKTTISKALEV